MISVRRIEPSQWLTYRDVRLRALTESPDAFGSTAETESQRPDSLWISRLEAASQSSGDHPLFAIERNTVCGLIWCKRSASNPAQADIFQLWVAPEYRSKGVGRALMTEALGWATRSGFMTVRLGVTIAETPAFRLYTSLGFKPVGDPQQLREGSSLMAQDMELSLSAA